jgi:hypothetical protein
VRGARQIAPARRRPVGHSWRAKYGNSSRVPKRFSDRAAWEAIHLDRLRRYMAGESVVNIAIVHGVKKRTVFYSIERCLARMPARQADAIRMERWERKRSTGRYAWEWIFHQFDRLEREQSRLWRLLGSIKP